MRWKGAIIIIAICVVSSCQDQSFHYNWHGSANGMKGGQPLMIKVHVVPLHYWRLLLIKDIQSE